MKWIILALILLRQVMALPAADLSLKVFGTVKDIVSGEVVVDHEVTISVENYNPPIYFVSHVSTNDTGFYLQQFFLPLNYGQITVATFDCESNLIENTFIFSFNNNSFNADFLICSEINTGCISNYDYEINPDNPLVLQFYDQSAGSIQKWEWSFGDGTNSILQNPIHQFPAPAVYLVCLKITDTITHCINTHCDYVAIENPTSCHANYTDLPIPGDNLSFQFIDQSVGSPVNWLWSFGDGNFSTEKNPLHVFEQPGLYNVCVSISNQTGNCNDQHCKYLLINDNPPCKAYFTFIETSVDPYTLKFNDSSFGNITEWHWDFGDGSISTLTNPSHAFMSTGVYEVCLTILDNINNCSHTFCETIFVGIQRNCEASFDYSQTFSEDNIIEFFDRSVGDIETRKWTFGDGTFSNENNPVHEFPGPGLYLTCLEISNDVSDCIDSYCNEIEIVNDNACMAGFSIHQDNNNPLLISFENLSSTNSDFFIWEFGDGNYSNEANPEHEYAQPGFYKVCLISSDSTLLCFDQYCDNIIIENTTIDCTAGFTFETSVSPDEIQFFDQSVGIITEWFWDFGDGNFSNLTNPSHVYQLEGTYSVCLSISNSETTCFDEICQEVVVDFPNPCFAQFAYNIDSGNPLKVHFSNISTGNITSWNWDFGNGQTSAQISPVHTFPAPGNYNVCLQAENQNYPQFCNDTYCIVIQLNVPPPECKAAFHLFLDTLSGVPNRYFFINDSEGSEPEYLWSFSDGLSSNSKDVIRQFETSGTFQAKLVVQSTDIWGQSCKDSLELSFQTPRYHSLGGLLFAGDYPINNPEPTFDTAQALLYRVYPDQIIPVDTATFSEFGYYSFSNVREGNYLVKTQLTNTSSRYSQFISTYLGDEVKWQETQPIEVVQDNLSANVHLKGSSRFLLAQGTISGIVDVDFHPVLFPDNNLTAITVLLSDESGKPIASVLTGQNGEFTFSSLKMGTYNVEVDLTGMNSTIENVIFDENHNSQVGVIIDVFAPSQVGIEEEKPAMEEFFVYPNPAKSVIYLQSKSQVFENIQVAVNTTFGSTIIRITTTLRPDEPCIIDLGSIPEGIYYVEVYSKEGLVETRKIIKIR